MKKIFFVIAVIFSASAYSQNIIANNWQVRFNTFSTFFTVGSATPTSADSISVWRNNKDWKHFGRAFLFKDSIPIQSAIGGSYLLSIDTSVGANQGQLKRILPSSLGIATGNTLYNGNGVLSGDRTVTGSTASLTFSTINNFVINSNYIGLAKTNGSYIYTARIGGTSDNYLQLGYTPTVVGGFSKGTALIIDTNNNLITGSILDISFPTYSNGNNLYTTNLVVNRDNYQGWQLLSTTTSITKGNGVYTFLIDASLGNITITLPNVSDVSSSFVGVVYNIKRIDNTANTVTIQAQGSDLIDGAASISLSSQWTSRSIQACSSNRWMIL